MDNPPFFEEGDEAAFFGDEGVDAGGFGVEVVSDRPLLPQRRHRHLNVCRSPQSISCGLA